MSQTSVDWTEVRRRLQKSEAALEEALSENPARIRTVFHQRAVRLASERVEDTQAARGTPALIFRLAEERYAVGLRHLSEVLPFKGCTQVPGSSPEFLGLIDVRGELRPVIDLARVLSGKTSPGAGTVLMLHRNAGLKVDSVEALREIRSDEMGPAVHGKYVQGLVSGNLPLLDAEAIISAVCSAKESRFA